MKKYYVTVNGNRYEVEVEEAEANSIQHKELAQTNIKQEVPEEVRPAQTISSHENSIEPGEKISCPMPGTIIKINVKNGDAFKEGDVLMVLEAMKMENEIMAPHSGKVVQLAVTKGAAVNAGDILLIIE